MDFDLGFVKITEYESFVDDSTEEYSNSKSDQGNSTYDETKGTLELVDIDMNADLDEELLQLIEKCDGFWKCKVCDKTSDQKHNIKRHTEKHIRGLLYTCSICERTYPTRNNLSSHITTFHSKLYDCLVCGKTGMNKRVVYGHKKKCNGVPEVSKGIFDKLKLIKA